MHALTRNTYIEGWARTTGGNEYKLRLDVPPDFPFEGPPVFVMTPKTLEAPGRGEPLNDLGSTHAFHTLCNGHNGHVQLCLSDIWEPSRLCTWRITEALLWLEVYELALLKECDIADFVG